MVTFELTQLLGLYFVIVGLIVIVRRTAFMPAIKQLMANRPLLIIVGMVEVFAGLAIVLAYPEVTFSTNGVIGLVGWMMLIEGVIYLLMPSKEVQKLVKKFNTPTWYLAGGLSALLLGAYLAGKGFGIL